jgi:Surface-adhesin protein E
VMLIVPGFLKPMDCACAPSPSSRTFPATTAATDWVSSCSSKMYGGTDIYVARSTIRRSGNLVKMWDMYDFKTTQVIGGYRVLSAKKSV